MASRPLQTFVSSFKKSGLVNRVLVTGGCGGFGQDLVPHLQQFYGADNVLITDIQNKTKVPTQYFRQLDVTNKSAIEEATMSFKPDTIIHLAGVAPEKGEEDPKLAIRVNAEGTRNVIEVATQNTLRIFAASTVATFGSLSLKRNTPDQVVQRPETMQGITKFYLELIGNYHRKRYGTDFRAVRYPIIVTPTLLPGKVNTPIVETFYEALRNKRYTSYLRPEKLLPTIYIDDAVIALLQLLETPKDKIKENTYNVSGCSFTPKALTESIKKHVPGFEVKYVDDARGQFFDSWPDTLNDSLARHEWGFDPQYRLDELTETMLAEVKKRL